MNKTLKKIDKLIVTGLIGAATGCAFHVVWGTILGALFDMWTGTKTEEYKKLKDAEE